MPPAIAVGIGMVGMAAAQAYGASEAADASRDASRSAAAAQERAAIAAAQERAAAMIHDSDNRLAEAKERYDFLEYDTREKTLTARFQMMTFLADRLDSSSTAMQIATKNAEVEITRITGDHDVRLHQLQLDAHEMDLREREIAAADGSGDNNDGGTPLHTDSMLLT